MGDVLKGAAGVAGTAAAPATGGASLAIPALLAAGEVGAGALSGALAPLPYQPKQAFTGDASAQNWLSELHNALGPLINRAGGDIQGAPAVSAPTRPAYEPHFAGAAPVAGNVNAFAAPPSGPQRRSTAFAAPPSPTPTSGPSPMGLSPDPMASPDPAVPALPPDQHAARLALMALSGKAA